MEKKPTLVVMAAGMGSRFGGLKQLTPVDEEGHFIIDFSLFDAYRAGFRRVVFIIKRELEQLFRETIGSRMESFFEVHYVFQELTDLPDGYCVPEGRAKPWGTAHAVMSSRHVVDGPFAVINADDFYGCTAFSVMYQFLSSACDQKDYAMVAYRLRNTVTEFGSVARGICEAKNGLLTGITERTKIFKKGEHAQYTEDGETFVPLDGGTLVSMNFWGFSARMLQQLWQRMPAFLDENLQKNPEKCEYMLPSVVNAQIEEGSAEVHLLPCEEQWYGVTYQQDLDSVRHAIAQMKQSGLYSAQLWDRCV